MLWVGAVLAVIAAILLAYVPHLPNANTSQTPGLTSGGVRITGSTGRRLRVFAVTQIAASFVLLAGRTARGQTPRAPQPTASRRRPPAPRASHHPPPSRHEKPR